MFSCSPSVTPGVVFALPVVMDSAPSVFVRVVISVAPAVVLGIPLVVPVVVAVAPVIVAPSVGGVVVDRLVNDGLVDDGLVDDGLLVRLVVRLVVSVMTMVLVVVTVMTMVAVVVAISVMSVVNLMSVVTVTVVAVVLVVVSVMAVMSVVEVTNNVLLVDIGVVELVTESILSGVRVGVTRATGETGSATGIKIVVVADILLTILLVLVITVLVSVIRRFLVGVDVSILTAEILAGTVDRSVLLVVEIEGLVSATTVEVVVEDILGITIIETITMRLVRDMVTIRETVVAVLGRGDSGESSERV